MASSPNWGSGYTPTAAEWNAQWASKADDNLTYSSLSLTTTFRLLVSANTSWNSFGNVAAVVATEGAQSSILGYIHNALTPNSPNLGAGINGYGRLESAGSAVFGAYGLAELRVANGTVVGAEFTSRNYGASPDVNLPPNQAIGTPTAVSNAVQITSGGTFASSIGLTIGKEGGSSVAFNTAQYIKDFNQYGLFIQTQPSGSQTGVVIQGNGNGLALQIQTTAAMTPNNAIIGAYDNGSVARFSVRQNGDIYGNVFNAAGGAVVAGGYMASNWNANGALPTALAGVAIGWNYTAGGSEVDYFNASASGGGHVFYQRGASTATRLMDISATGNVRAYAGIDNTVIGATTPAAISTTQLNLTNSSGPTIRSGAGAASGTQPKGSLWMRTDGGVGTTMYVSQGAGTWNAVAGV